MLVGLMNGDVKQEDGVYQYHGVVIELMIALMRLMNEIAVSIKEFEIIKI
jgi:hypothetical protein